MDRSNEPSRSSKKRLERVAAACGRCRRRKQKCDGKLPTCSTCHAAGVPCTPSDRLTIHVNSSCDCDNLRKRVGELETLLNQASSNLRSRGDAGIIDNGTNLNAAAVYSASGEESLDAINTVPRMTDFWSSRFLRPTFSISGVYSHAFSSALGSAWDLWGDDKSSNTPGIHFDAVETLSLSQYGGELVQTFFDNYWAHLPILHRPSFMRHHYLPVLDGASATNISKFQVYMVFAIASCGRAKTSGGHSLSHEAFFKKASTYLPFIACGHDLEFIQCLLLLCMYGRKEPQCVDMWHTTGLALRTAVGIDLHKQESQASRGTLEGEMSKRLFWSAYVMDRSMAIAMGRPLGVDDAVISLELPHQLTDEQLESYNDVSSDETFVIPEIHDTSTFIHVIKIRQLNARIYTTFYSTLLGDRDGTLDDMRIKINDELDTWLISAPRYIRKTSMFQSPEWFEIAYYHAILSLYRPSPAFPMPSLEALHHCAESSISLITRYASLYAQNKVSYSFIALNSVFMAAMTMLYALRASSSVRRQLSETVVRSNIETCVRLCEGMSEGRKIAEKCSSIIRRLGDATLASFERTSCHDASVDNEFLSWFGLRSSSFAPAESHDSDVYPNGDGPEQSYLTDIDGYDPPSIDMAWKDIFPGGMDFDDMGVINFSL